MLQLNNIIKTPISTFLKFVFEVFVLITEKSKLLLTLIQGTLVPKLTLGPFLTLSVRNGHNLNVWVFGIPAHIQSKSR